MSQAAVQKTPRGGAVWALVITSVAGFMAALDNLVVTTALPSIREGAADAERSAIRGERGAIRTESSTAEATAARPERTTRTRCDRRAASGP